MSSLDKVMKLKDGKILYDDARARVEELKATKAPAITNTLSGASAHIEDAAELPLEKLVVSFGPVQSGSGDPSPSNVRSISGWTELSARITGENLIDDTLRYVVNDTTVYIGATDNEYHLFLKAGTYTILCDFDESYGMYFREQNDSENRTLWYSSSGTYSATFTTEADGLYRFWVYRNPNLGVIDPTKIHSVTLVVASTVSDYSIVWVGKNLVDKSALTQGAIRAADGTITASETRVVTDFIPVKPNTTYIASFEEGKNVKSARCYDANKTPIGETFSAGNQITTISGTAYLRFTIGYNSAGVVPISVSDVEQPQLELGSTATAYEPYISTTNEVGTVYGGTVDLVSGTLSVTMQSVDMGTLNYTTSESGGVTVFRNNIGAKSVSDYYQHGFNSVYPFAGTRFINTMPDKTWMIDANGRIYVRDDSYNDVASFKTAVTGYQMVYELATPQTIQLSSQTIVALRGINNISSPSGSVEVTYRADTKEFISNFINPNVVKKTDYVTADNAGIVRVAVDLGIQSTQNGLIYIKSASEEDIKLGSDSGYVRKSYRPIVPNNQHLATFYGLAKVAGADEKNSQLAVGTYSDTAKTAIRTMLGAVGNSDYATSSTPGITKVKSDYGLFMENGYIKIFSALASSVKNGVNACMPITANNQHLATFYGLAKIAGVDEKTSSLEAGQYTNEAKAAIQSMLGVADASTKVDKTAIDNAGIINKTYTTKFNGQFSVTTAVDQNYISPYVRASVTGRISKHKNHRVTINGQQYILPTRLWYLREGEGIKVYQYLGNLNLYVSDTTGVPDGTDDVPFIIISDINDSSSIDVLTETAGTYTILVEQIDNTQTALPKSLIWDDSYVPILKNNNGGTYNGFSIGVNELNSTRGTCAIGYGNIINNQFSYSIGLNNTINGINGIAIGNLNTVAGGFAFGSHLLADKTNMTAVGYQNAASKSHTTWAANTQYNVGDVVYATIGGRSLYLICATAHTSTNVISDVANWKTNPSNGDTAFVVGNGNPINTSSRSNALKLDWIGNLYLGGNVYVGAGADSTGGTKLAALSDVQINSTSIISNGIANIPIASSSTAGVVKIPSGMGLYINPGNGEMLISSASSANIKEGANLYRPLSPAKQHEATFYGLSKAAGVDMSSSSNEVGTYTDAAKTAIQNMIGVENGVTYVENISDTDVSISGVANTRYICGTVSTISITPPSAGIIDVVFTSGTSPAVLTLPNTVKLPAWFDKTTLDTETTYEINIADGVLGAVMTWA